MAQLSMPGFNSKGMTLAGSGTSGQGISDAATNTGAGSLSSTMTNAGKGIADAVSRANSISDTANNAKLGPGAGVLGVMEPVPSGGKKAKSGETAANDIEKQLYTVMTGYLKLADGTTLPVSGFTLTLQQNGIPGLLLNTIPEEGQGDPSEGNADAFEANLAIFVDLFARLKGLVEHQTNRLVEFHFLAQSVGGDIQQLDLYDWVMVGVGFPQISASGALAMAISVQHPARTINESPMQLYGLPTKDLEPASNVDPGDNVLEGFKSALNWIKNMVSAGAPTTPVLSLAQDPATGYKTMQKRFVEAVDAFDARFTWDAVPGAITGYPEANAPGGLHGRYHNAIWQQTLSVQHRTVWDWFANGICSDWFLSIMPTFAYTTLSVGPFNPWATAMIELDQMNVLQFSNPPEQSLLLAGTMMNLMLPVTATVEVTDNASAMQQFSEQFVCYVEPQLYGAVLGIEPPSWWRALHGELSAAKSPGSIYIDDDQSPFLATDKAETITPAPDQSLLAPGMAEWAADITKEAFIEHYQRDLRVRLLCRLMITYPGSQLPGNYMLPGCVINLNTAPSGATTTTGAAASNALMRFFCTEISHTVDCSQRQAFTTVAGGYVRCPNSASNLLAIPDGVAYNVLYGAVGADSPSSGSRGADSGATDDGTSERNLATSAQDRVEDDSAADVAGDSSSEERDAGVSAADRG